MTAGDRYQQYDMETDFNEGKVYFYMTQKSEMGTIGHNLSDMHVATIDTPDKKVVCRSGRLFALKLSAKAGHRYLYFLSYPLLLEGIKSLLGAQKFTKHINQYKLIS